MKRDWAAEAADKIHIGIRARNVDAANGRLDIVIEAEGLHDQVARALRTALREGRKQGRRAAWMRMREQLRGIEGMESIVDKIFEKEALPIVRHCTDDYRLRGRVDPTCPCELIGETVEAVREEMRQELARELERHACNFGKGDAKLKATHRTMATTYLGAAWIVRDFGKVKP